MVEFEKNYLVAVIGAGPAGLYATEELNLHGVNVVLINRDIKPGGLAEYGIFPDKTKLKAGLRNHFRLILSSDMVDYFGNLTIGQEGELNLEELSGLGFDALLVTTGAQGTKWLGLPGEKLRGVFHAKDLVYHYNLLPPFSRQNYSIGRKVSLIGAGNVMVDVAHWCIRYQKVDEVVAIVRRGPAEVKFDKKEFYSIASNLDIETYNREMERVSESMTVVGQDPIAAKQFILSTLEKALDPITQTRFRFKFLASPVRILGDEKNQVKGIEIEDTKLITLDGQLKSHGTGLMRTLETDTVIFCIGDTVDEHLGLPTHRGEYVKNPCAIYPQDGLSYEAYNPENEQPIPGIFIAGWARESSKGLVGVTRKDGTNGAKAVLEYLTTISKQPVSLNTRLEKITQRIRTLPKRIITKEDWKKLEAIEKVRAEAQGLLEYKFSTNEEMLSAMGG